MPKLSMSEIYKPNVLEASRQAFVGAMKGYVNGPLERDLSQLYDTELEPAFEKEHGRKPADRVEGATLLDQSHLYKLWGSLVYTSQDLLWESCGETIDRQRPEFQDCALDVEASNKKLGSLTLNPEMVLPEPIASLEIHRQPGGYFYESDAKDLTSPLQYFSSIELYRTAKGLSTGKSTGEPGMMQFMLHNLKQKFPNFKPKRILDMGCAIGTETVGLAEMFPDAEIHGVELSSPFLRFAHLWAEDKGVPVHYRQANANDTGYEDGYFDLIISHILFHETWTDILPGIMKEANRLLASGGIFYNADVPYQPTEIPMIKQITNGWQERYNGEPFWNKFADTDVMPELNKAGFEGDNAFAYYVPLGAGQYYMFGGTKP